MLRWTGGNRARAEFEMQQIRSRKSNSNHINNDTAAPINVNATEVPGSTSTFGGSRPLRADPEFHNNINTNTRTSSSTDVRSLRRIGRQQRTHTIATPPTSIDEAQFLAHESSSGVPTGMLGHRDPNTVYDDQPPGSWPQGGCNYNSLEVDDGNFAPHQHQPQQLEQQNGELFFSNSVEGFFPQPPAPLDDSHFDLNAARVFDGGNGGWDGGPDDDDDVHDPYTRPTDFSGLLMPPNHESFQHPQFLHQEQQQWSATPPSWGERHPAMMAGADGDGDFSGNQTPNAWHGGVGNLSAPLMPQPCQWPGGAVRNVGGGEFAFPDPIPTRRTDRRPNGINSSDLELAPQLSPVLPVPEDHHDDQPWGWNEQQQQQQQPPPNGNRQRRKWSFSSAPFPQHLLPPPRVDEPVIGQHNGAADMFPAGALLRNTKIGGGAPSARNPHMRGGNVRPQPAHRLPLRRFGGGKNATSGAAASAQRGVDTKRSRPATRVKPLKQKRREGAGLDSGRPSDDDGDDSFQQPEDHVMFTPGLLFRTPRTP